MVLWWEYPLQNRFRGQPEGDSYFRPHRLSACNVYDTTNLSFLTFSKFLLLPYPIFLSSGTYDNVLLNDRAPMLPALSDAKPRGIPRVSSPSSCVRITQSPRISYRIGKEGSLLGRSGQSVHCLKRQLYDLGRHFERSHTQIMSQDLAKRADMPARCPTCGAVVSRVGNHRERFLRLLNMVQGREMVKPSTALRAT